jgi:hypothetical protein
MAIVKRVSETNGCNKKIMGSKVIVKIQKGVVPGMRMAANRSGQASCREIKSSETQEKLTRLINKIMRTGQMNKLSFLFRKTNQESPSEMNGINE